jgi:hypothetical protein
MRSSKQSRDPRSDALRDVYRGGMSDQSDPRTAALADLADPMRAPKAKATSDVIVRPIGEGLHEDAVALPGGGQASIDDLEARGEMTPDLWRKTRPDVSAYHDAHPDDSASSEDERRIESSRRHTGR